MIFPYGSEPDTYRFRSNTGVIIKAYKHYLEWIKNTLIINPSWWLANIANSSGRLAPIVQSSWWLCRGIGLVQPWWVRVWQRSWHWSISKQMKWLLNLSFKITTTPEFLIIYASQSISIGGRSNKIECFL